MANVAANFNAEVSTNGTRVGLTRHGGTQHLAARGDGALAFPDHGHNRARGHVGDQTGEKLLAGKVSVMLFHVLLTGGSQLHGNQLEALGFETLDNFADNATLDAIGLDLVEQKRDAIA